MSAQAAASSSDFQVRDLSLAEWGRKEIAVAEQVAAERKAAGLLARLGHRSRKLLGHFGRRSP